MGKRYFLIEEQRSSISSDEVSRPSHSTPIKHHNMNFETIERERSVRLSSTYSYYDDKSSGEIK